MKFEEVKVYYSTVNTFILSKDGRPYSNGYINPKYPRLNEFKNTYVFFTEKEKLFEFVEKHKKRLEKNTKLCSQLIKKLIQDG